MRGGVRLAVSAGVVTGRPDDGKRFARRRVVHHCVARRAHAPATRRLFVMRTKSNESKPLDANAPGGEQCAVPGFARHKRVGRFVLLAHDERAVGGRRRGAV